MAENTDLHTGLWSKEGWGKPHRVSELLMQSQCTDQGINSSKPNSQIFCVVFFLLLLFLFVCLFGGSFVVLFFVIPSLVAVSHPYAPEDRKSGCIN